MLTRAQRTHAEFGQSLWYDNIQRNALNDGEFARLVAAGVRGCTSNPAIFNKAIAGSTDYDATIRSLAKEGKSTEEIYVALVVADIRQAADQLHRVYEDSRGEDGYVSVEVLPRAAHDAEATVREALELVELIQRDNLMIKVPATPAGLTAFTELIARGISVNVTLLFSKRRYVEVAEAYLAGLERAHQAGVALNKIASVASFFISRIDSAIDPLLAQNAATHAAANGLLGKVAIANAKLAYAEFEQLFGGARFAALSAHGARPQRLLWASTGTKNAAYPDTLYVDGLIGRETVNTIPPDTLAAFQDHGAPQASLAAGMPQAREVVDSLEAVGISLEAVCEKLLEEGLGSFVQAMDALLAAVAKRRAASLVPDGGSRDLSSGA